MLEALHRPFARIVSAETVNELLGMTRHAWDGAGERHGDLREQLVEDARELGRAVHELAANDGQPTPVEHFVANLDDGLSLTVRLNGDPTARSLPPPNRALWLALLAWLAVRGIGGPSGIPDRNLRCRRRMRDWGLDDMVAAAFRQIGRSKAAARRGTEAVAAIIELPMWSPQRRTADASAVLASWLVNDSARRALRVHRPRNSVDRYDADAYEELVVWTTWVAAVRLAEYPQAYQRANEPMLKWVAALSRDLLSASVAAGDRVDRLLAQPAGPDNEGGSA